MPFKSLEDIRHCTAFVSADKETDTEYGTAFFFDLQTDDGHIEPLLITCRHVVEGCKHCEFYLSRQKDGARQPNPQHIPVPTDWWRFHPDRDVDLAALQLTRVLNGWEADGYVFVRPAIASAMIAKEGDVSLADDILTVGYPNRLWDGERNLPLFSKGIAATHPLEDFEQKPEFIIDAAFLGGSSGSPVFSHKFVKGDSFSPKLLGILHGGPAAPITGLVGEDGKEERLTIQLPMNFAWVTHGAKLLDFQGVLSVEP